MLIKRKYLHWLLVLLPAILFAQNTGRVAGLVTDAHTGEPLTGVNIVVEDTRFGSASDEDGFYLIKNIPLGDYNITAAMMGYKKVTQEIRLSGRKIRKVDFKLKKQALKMQAIRVTAQSEIQEMRKAPEAIVVIDAKEIRGRAISLEDVLDKAAGIKVRSSGGMGSSSRIMIHGLEGKRIQIFIDNNPVNSPDGSFAIDEIPIDLIERIEVYKGIVPARLGGDGIGGAVNVIIRSFEKDYIDLSYSKGSYNTNRATWVFKKVFDKFGGMQIGWGGFYNYADNDYSFKSPFRENLTIKRDHDKYYSLAMGGGFTFTKLWFDKLVIGSDFYTNNRETQGIQKNIQHAEFGSIGFIPGIELEKAGFFHKNLDFKYIGGVLFGKLNNIDTSHVNYDFDGNIYNSPGGQGEVGMGPNNSDDEIFEVRQSLNLNYKFNNSHNINLNSVFRYAERRPDDKLASKFAGYNIAGYPSDMTSIITGLTYESKYNNEKIINMLSGKLFYYNSDVAAIGDAYGGALLEDPETKSNKVTKYGFSEAMRWRIHPALVLKASVQHALRLPTPDELFGNGVAITPAPELKPETSNNLNLGFLFGNYRVFGMERAQIEVNGFYMALNDMIKLQGGAVTLGYVNLGEVEIKGVDAEIKLDITKNIYAYTNATFQDVCDVMKNSPGSIAPNPTKDMRLPNIPYFFTNFGVEYHAANLFGENQYSKIFWDSRFTEEFFYNWEMSNRQHRRIPRTFIHDFGVQHSFDHNRYIISAEIHNITNEDALSIYNMPLMGRTFQLKVRYSIVKQ